MREYKFYALHGNLALSYLLNTGSHKTQGNHCRWITIFKILLNIFYLQWLPWFYLYVNIIIDFWLLPFHYQFQISKNFGFTDLRIFIKKSQAELRILCFHQYAFYFRKQNPFIKLIIIYYFLFYTPIHVYYLLLYYLLKVHR